MRCADDRCGTKETWRLQYTTCSTDRKRMCCAVTHTVNDIGLNERCILRTSCLSSSWFRLSRMSIYAGYSSSCAAEKTSDVRWLCICGCFASRPRYITDKGFAIRSGLSQFAASKGTWLDWLTEKCLLWPFSTCASRLVKDNIQPDEMKFANGQQVPCDPRAHISVRDCIPSMESLWRSFQECVAFLTYAHSRHGSRLIEWISSCKTRINFI